MNSQTLAIFKTLFEQATSWQLKVLIAQNEGIIKITALKELDKRKE